MSQKGLEVQKNYPLRKKVSEFFWGGWCMQTNWNYERQMNTAFMWGISKTIDRLYPEPEELEKKKERYRSSLEFFNITPQMGSFVLGLTAAMEEQYAENPKTFDPKMISSLKTALMGPLSGIGDSLFQGTVRIIAMSIGISLAQQGSILGPILAMLISFAVSFLITWWGGKLGYVKGQELIHQIAESNLMDKVMYGCSVAGLMVVGGMAATLVNVTTPLAYGESLILQTVLDGIMPKMIPLLLTGIMYWLVKKGVHPIVIVIACFIIGIILNYFGILVVA
ncbi:MULTISPECIES: PTS system mannose/fructose/sorbose family transporter subunit IID [Faecalibacillus]|jgi:fructoselysine and glucoselysine-specific PTS system IID component|uniref:PTS system mannose/fructose/sorbose family transporter subunit IID n=1 Tax=Faecalibacillus intestinalis TaxID=1982626 RepID=A0AAW4VHZ0_9FIRM|nr:MULTISPECIES: PTS system mannose/fructose/sorbose family transporter subunit IID [Faecalibacillus]MCB8561952.1 PTS system mannose/fructose/sorbose family transporter subunit IID [Faecalibacillus intestinalis]MCG4809410.1 PTS system mannose/fructose/sorbose family transporter subunit IID [Faecalibacillus intestinalis]RHP70582.1 PTS system mannose/fructose/sorbose family transporter subunit IID [Coprobacillus sp. OF03-2AA]